MWKTNKQTNKHRTRTKTCKGEDNQRHNMATKAKKTKQKPKLGFLGSSLCMHEQACVCRQDYAYTGSCPKNPKNTTIEKNT